MAENKPWKLNEFTEKMKTLAGKPFIKLPDLSDKDTLKKATRAIFAFLVRKSVFVLLSFLFGSSGSLFNTFPFGFALLCATTDNVVYVYLGLLLASLTFRHDAFAFFMVYTGSVLLRIAFSKWYFAPEGEIKKRTKESKTAVNLFHEPFSLRLLNVIVCSLAISLARLMLDGFLYYDLFGLIACILVSPLLFCAYYGFTKGEAIPKQLYEICSAVCIFSVIYSIRLYYVLGFSAAVILSYLVTLYSSKKFGIFRGCAVGLFCGLAVNISSAPMFALMGFAFGIISNYSLFAAVFASSVIGLLFGVSSTGFSAFSTVLPELAVGSAIFLPLAYYDLLPSNTIFMADSALSAKEKEMTLVSEEKLKFSTKSLEAISASFDELSVTLAALSDKLKRPGVLDVKAICEDSFHKHCGKCSLAGVCYGRDCTSTFDVIGKLTRMLNEKGRIDMTDIPEYMGSRCSNILKIVSDINIAYSHHIEKLIKNDKISIFALDYKAMSKLILDASKTRDEEYELNHEISAKIMRALRYMDINAENVFVYGSRRLNITVTGINIAEIKTDSKKICRALENVCEAKLSLPVFEIVDDRATMTLSEVPAFTAEFAKATVKKESSDTNGDTALSFSNDSGCSYFLISDGMGSGREAAMTSRICAMFLSKLLSAGCSKSIVIEMLNGFIRSKAEECSATVDLAEFDLLSGKGCFVKSGAAPSYILRGKNLYKLQSKTLPIGILRDTDAEMINFELYEDDIIVMFSDGVASSLEDGAWITSLLCFEFEDDLEKMADKILEKALEYNLKSDDMTVGLIRITKNTQID